MSLAWLDDPGLTVFATHRLLCGFADEPERQQALGNGLRELFDVEEVAARRSTRPARRASASSASTTPSTGAPSGCG